MNGLTVGNMPKLPRHVARSGAVSATTWVNARTVDGQLIEFPQVELVKNYRDTNGAWQKTSRFEPTDLLDVAAVAKRVYEALGIREEWPASTEKQVSPGRNRP